MPLKVAANDGKRHFAQRHVRCRNCGACRRAHRNYWGYAAMEQTKQAHDRGDRSWFGTLELSPTSAAELTARAMKASGEPSAAWWRQTERATYFCKRRRREVTVDSFVCDHRFSLVVKQMHSEARKYFRRLRHAGLRFKYLIVYERHKSGIPHAHFIFHEDGCRALKRVLREHWPLGYFQAKLIGGTARDAPAPEKAAWYAVKYLTKNRQARVKASPGYRPEKRVKP